MGKEDIYMQMYKAGLSDKEIAAKVGVRLQTVKNWRWRYNYIANPEDTRLLQCLQSGCKKYRLLRCAVLTEPGWQGGQCWAWTDDEQWEQKAAMAAQLYERGGAGGKVRVNRGGNRAPGERKAKAVR